MSTGLEDLLRRLGGDEPEVALLLVKAPLGVVVSALADTYGTSSLVEDAPIREATAKTIREPGGWLAAIRQPDAAWTTVYVALGEVVELECDLVRQVAADLSETLLTEAIAFMTRPVEASEEDGEDAGLGVEFEAFSSGDVHEHLRWRADGALEIFESESRDAPENSNRVPLELASRLFADRGLYVPACAPASQGPKTWLVVWDLDPARIERAELFRLRGSQFFEEETLAMEAPDLDAPDASEPPPDEDETEDEGAETTSGGGLLGFFQRFFPGRHGGA